jgi:mRNA deadenylase 3'-5' endonuclease subunit Ccr4
LQEVDDKVFSEFLQPHLGRASFTQAYAHSAERMQYVMLPTTARVLLLCSWYPIHWLAFSIACCPATCCFLQPDICCLQEVDDKVFSEFLQPHLGLAGCAPAYVQSTSRLFSQTFLGLAALRLVSSSNCSACCACWLCCFLQPDTCCLQEVDDKVFSEFP